MRSIGVIAGGWCPRCRPLQELGTLMLQLAPTYRLLFMLLVIVFYIYATIGEPPGLQKSGLAGL